MHLDLLLVLYLTLDYADEDALFITIFISSEVEDEKILLIVLISFGIDLSIECHDFLLSNVFD